MQDDWRWIINTASHLACKLPYCLADVGFVERNPRGGPFAQAHHASPAFWHPMLCNIERRLNNNNKINKEKTWQPWLEPNRERFQRVCLFINAPIKPMQLRQVWISRRLQWDAILLLSLAPLIYRVLFSEISIWQPTLAISYTTKYKSFVDNCFSKRQNLSKLIHGAHVKPLQT